MINVKTITERLENAVIADQPAKKIVERHEIPMTIDDFVMNKTMSSIAQLRSVMSEAEEFFSRIKLG